MSQAWPHQGADAQGGCILSPLILICICKTIMTFMSASDIRRIMKVILSQYAM